MQPTRDEVARLLPVYRGDLDIYTLDQDTPDIIGAIELTHEQEQRNYDKISGLFDGETAEEIGESCFNFLKENFRYHAEDEELQTTRTPSAIVATGRIKGIDCKNYSLFTAGIIDSLNRKYYSIPWCFRFAAYPKNGFPNRYLRHVFVVMYPGTSDEIWIDPVLGSFNSREKIPCYKKDLSPMLGKLSGLGTPRMGWNTMGQDGSDGIDLSNINVIDPNLVSATDTGTTTQEQAATGYTIPSYVTTAADTNIDPTTAGGDIGLGPGLSDTITPSTGTTVSSSSGNFFSNLIKSVTGGSVTPSTGGSSGGISLGTGKTTTPTTGSGSGTAVNIYTAAATPSTGTSTTTLLIIGAVLVGGLVLFMANRKK